MRAKTPWALWKLALLLGLWMALAGNLPLWRALWALPEHGGARGLLFSLAIAIWIAAALTALLSLLAPWFVRSIWALLAFSSLWTFGASFFSTSALRIMLPSVECDTLLSIAQSDYLKGQYFEAEATLHRILSTGHEDIEAALLLASVLRRTGRFRQAQDCLERLERLDRSRTWSSEIASERRRCKVSPANSTE